MAKTYAPKSVYQNYSTGTADNLWGNPSHTLDGANGTYAFPDTTGTAADGSYLSWDFGTGIEYVITQINLTTVNDQDACYDFYASSDGTNWTKIIDNYNTLVGTYHIPVTATKAKYIRIMVDNANGDSAGNTPCIDYISIVGNEPPSAPTLTNPTDTRREILRPVFEATIGDDIEDNKQNFVIQIAENNGFTTGLQERNTETSQTGWQAKTATGSFAAFPSGGVDATHEGGTVRHSWQADLIEGKTYYWRMAAIDGSSGNRGAWSATRSIRVGDTLKFTTAAIQTSAAAARIVISAQDTIATDGATPAAITVEVSNNALDAAPVWEDATNAFKTGQYHTFANASKTAANWAVAVRVTVKANDSLQAIEIDGIGYSFD